MAKEHGMDVVLEMDKKSRGLARLAITTLTRSVAFCFYDQLDFDFEQQIETLILR